MQTTNEHDGSPTEDEEDAERAEAREEQFRTLAENIPGVATFLDRITDDPGHSIPLYISPQVEPMLGYPLHEWLDESELWLRILHPEDRDRLVAADENARKHKLTLSEEYRLLHREGHVVWVSERAAVVPDVSTGTLYWQGVMVDITTRKRAEQAMADSELKFRTLFDAAAIGVFTLALDGRITEANATIEWLGRYDEGALSGVALADLVEPDDEEILDELAELRAGHRDRCRAEHRFRRKDGSFLWCRTVVTLVRGPDLLPLYAMGMLEDISARKLVEDELLHRAVHDVLTGLPNRQLLLDRLTMALARTAREPDVGATLVFLDLDDFKVVNDTFGHGAGDELLIQVAERLSAAVRPTDTVARYGGRRVRRDLRRRRVEARRRPALRRTVGRTAEGTIHDRGPPSHHDGEPRGRELCRRERPAGGRDPRSRRRDVSSQARRPRPHRALRIAESEPRAARALSRRLPGSPCVGCRRAFHVGSDRAGRPRPA